MPIGKVLLLKALGGLTALGGAIGGVCYIHNLYSNKETTRFDEGLIDYLEAGGKIQFSVKEGNGTTDIGDSFPTFTTGTDTKTATVTIKVSVNASSTGGNNDGTLTDATTTPIPEKGKKETLQKLNGTDAGTAWTWVCEVKFTKKADDTTATELKDKDKLVKSAESKGFFNKLKDTDTNTKDLKIKFIKDCAAARGKDKNKKIDELTSLKVTNGVITTANEIKSTKEFELRKGDTASSEEATKLYPVNQSDFDRWFKNEGN